MNEFDISPILAHASLETASIDPKKMWTGMVKPWDVNELLIPDADEVKEFRSLLTNHINEIIVYKEKRSMKLFTFDIEERIHANEELIMIKIKSLSSKGKFNVPVFSALLNREYEKVLKSNPKEFGGNYTNMGRQVKMFSDIANKEPGLFTVVYNENTKLYDRIEILTEKQLKRMGYNPNNSKNLMEYYKILYGKDELSEEEIDSLENKICSTFSLDDLHNVYASNQFADNTTVWLTLNSLLKSGGYTYEQLKKMKHGDVIKALTGMYAGKISYEEHTENVRWFLRDTIDFIDINKLMLIYFCKNFKRYDELTIKVSNLPEGASIEEVVAADEDESKNEFGQGLYEENAIFEEIAKDGKMAENLIKSKKIKSYESAIDCLENEVSITRLKNYMKNFCDGYYLSKVVYELLIKDSIEFLDKYSDELLQRISKENLDNNSYLILYNSNSIKRLNELGLLNESDIRQVLKVRNDKEKINDLYCDHLNERYVSSIKEEDGPIDDLFVKICESNFLSIEEYRKLLNENLISSKDIINVMDFVPKNVSEKIKESFNEECLLRKYDELSKKTVEYKKKINLNATENDEINALKEEVNKIKLEKENILKLYNHFYKVSEENKEARGNELLEKYYLEILENDQNVDEIQEVLNILYEDGLINLENILEFSGENKYLLEMLDKLSLADCKKIRENRSIDQMIDLLDRLFSDKNISDDERFVTLMNLFINDSSAEGRKLLDKYLNRLSSSDIEKKNVYGGTRNFGGGTTADSQTKIYTDTTKWEFFMALDKDASVKRYANGFVVFTSKKFGCRIIERYYEKNGKMASGVATYMMSENEWRKNQGDLETILPYNKTVLEGAEVRNIVSNKDKIIHRTRGNAKTWMDEIANYFGINFSKDSRYTDEELKALKDFIERRKHDYIIL